MRLMQEQSIVEVLVDARVEQVCVSVDAIASFPASGNLTGETPDLIAPPKVWFDCSSY